jgi:hypothetical protein
MASTLPHQLVAYIPPFGTVNTSGTGTVTVTWTPEERERLMNLAGVRTDGMRASGVPTQKVSRFHDDHEIDVLGLMAEVAFALVFNAGTVRVGTTVDEGYDFMVDGGWTVDVKATFGREVLAFRKKGLRADVAFLIVREDDLTVRLVGWAFATDGEFGPQSTTAASKLRPVSEFSEFLLTEANL